VSTLVPFEGSTAVLLPLVALLVVGIYVFRLGKCSASDNVRQEVETRSGGAWRWFVLPVGLALVVSALVKPWPMTLRFSLSREAFEQTVTRIYVTRSEQGGQRVGLYWIKGVNVEPSGYVRFATGTSVIDPAGFAYDPKRPPPGRLRRHITGNWYATEW
jgi:hypothetical protein